MRPGATAAALATKIRSVGVIATPATIRSHAYFQAIKDENPFVEVYEHATPEFVPLVEAGRLRGPDVDDAVRRGLAPLLGSRDGDGEWMLPLPLGAGSTPLAAGLHPLPIAGGRDPGRRRRRRGRD